MRFKVLHCLITDTNNNNIIKENARARGYDLLGPAYLGGQGFGYGGRCEEEVV